MKSIPIIAALTLATLRLLGAEDILVADFEGPTYGTWTTTGEAFGPGPARGTLPGQMAVSGFKGQGLANSFHKGDDSRGTLTSSMIFGAMKTICCSHEAPTTATVSLPFLNSVGWALKASWGPTASFQTSQIECAAVL